MLIRFNVKNFLSFATRENGQSEEFSMIAGKVRNKGDHLYYDGKIKLLKFAAVYGANAAGKSNLVKAIDFMKKTIISGLPDGYTEKYCRIDATNKNKPSYFEIEILLNNKYYSYGFEIILNQSRFISEWLIELHPDNSETVLFTRDIEDSSYELGSLFNKDASKNKLDVYAGDIKSDSSVLLLSVMNQNKRDLYKANLSVNIFKSIYLWIANNLDVNYPAMPISNYFYLNHINNFDKVCNIISAFGTGITDLKIVDVSLDRVLRSLPRYIQNSILSQIEQKKVEVTENNLWGRSILAMRTSTMFFFVKFDADEQLHYKTIEFGHGKEKVLFNLDEESDGTIRLLDLLEILIAGDSKTYVIDELDRCLHPSLTYKFVETFLHIAQEKNIQLIVTTHESRLLDFDLLRRDEIWFIDKKETGSSDIYSLEEYNARFDKKIDKAYLEGRYGGVPVFNTIFPVEE